MGKIYDTVIVGGGPAGFTAGIYASRSRMDVILVESLSIMGQATMTDMIENYPGVPATNGYELMAGFRKQAEEFGLTCVTGTVASITFSVSQEGVPVWTVTHDEGEIRALSVILATGARSKKLGVHGEDEFAGRGVSYCATCDGAFFRDKDIVVVGGGDTAVEEAIFLTRFGRSVKLVHRKARLRAASILQERAMANDKMGFVLDSVVEEICGTDKVEKVKVRNVKTGNVHHEECQGVFVFVGWSPNTSMVEGVADADEHGAVIVGSDMSTSARGLFAAGDCSARPLHQVVTACGDGAVAAQSARFYVEGLKGTSYK